MINGILLINNSQFKWYNQAIGLMSWVFINGQGDWGLFPKTPKIVLDAALFNDQHY